MYKNRTPTDRWSLEHAMILTAACLMAGIAGGWMLRVWTSPAVQRAAVASPASAVNAPAQASTPAQLRQRADAEAAPLLVQLQSNPANPDLLTSLGNLYYDAQQYRVAVDYYARVLAIKPSDAAVRTDMGTALWYMGNADRAIGAFNQALVYDPDNPNTLFNRGLVRWQGKMDAAGALEDWKKLLQANPSYPDKDKVEQMMAEVQKHVSLPAQQN